MRRSSRGRPPIEPVLARWLMVHVGVGDDDLNESCVWDLLGCEMILLEDDEHNPRLLSRTQNTGTSEHS
jgi:hypothetical protein